MTALQPTTRYTAAVSGYGASIHAMRMATPTTAPMPTTQSILVWSAPSRASTVTAV